MNHETLIALGILVLLVIFYVSARYFFGGKSPEKPIWEREYDVSWKNNLEPLGNFYKEKEAQEKLDTAANKALRRVVKRKKPTTTRRKAPKRNK